MKRVGFAVAATAAVTAAIVFFGPGATRTGWAQVVEMVQAASASAPCVHLRQEMRTSDREDFSFVDLAAEPMEVEAWICWPRENGEPGRARVEKKNRIYLFNGRETVHYRPQVREAARFAGGKPRLDEFWPAAWLQQLVELPRGGVISVEQDDAAGRLVLHWDAPALNGLPPAFFEDYEREVEIHWDPASKRLTGFERRVIVQGQRRVFSELLSIDYPPSLPENLFALDLPPDVRWVEMPEAPSTLASLGPRQAAEQFWVAAIHGDWKTVALFCPQPSTVEWLRGAQPMELLSLGEPVTKGSYPGVFLPYKVRYRDGTREHRVALRNDNEARRWVVDGGI